VSSCTLDPLAHPAQRNFTVAALANHFDGPLPRLLDVPRLRSQHRNHASAEVRSGARLRPTFLNLRSLKRFHGRPMCFGRHKPVRPRFYHRDHITADGAPPPWTNIKPIGPPPMIVTRVADFYSGLMQNRATRRPEARVMAASSKLTLAGITSMVAFDDAPPAHECIPRTLPLLNSKSSQRFSWCLEQ